MTPQIVHKLACGFIVVFLVCAHNIRGSNAIQIPRLSAQCCSGAAPKPPRDLRNFVDWIDPQTPCFGQYVRLKLAKPQGHRFGSVCFQHSEKIQNQIYLWSKKMNLESLRERVRNCVEARRPAIVTGDGSHSCVSQWSRELVNSTDLVYTPFMEYIIETPDPQDRAMQHALALDLQALVHSAAKNNNVLKQKDDTWITATRNIFAAVVGRAALRKA